MDTDPTVGEFYLIMTVAVLALGTAGYVLWKRSQNLAFLFGVAVLYFWSLHGAWAIITDGAGGDSGKRYHYLLDRLFEVQLNSDYAEALILYAVFAIVVMLVAALYVAPEKRRLSEPGAIWLDHGVVIGVAGVAGVISFAIVRDSLNQAMQSDVSAYILTRYDRSVGSLFSIHQALNRLALLPAMIGAATLLSGKNGRFLRADHTFNHLVGYGLVLAGMAAMCVALGNKAELFAAVVSAGLFYVYNEKKPRLLRLAAIGFPLIVVLGIIDYVRAFGLASLTTEASFADAWESFTKMADSNEGFGAHMSMYGALHFDVPPTYGTSLLSLAASVVPRFMWAERPDDIYVYYADHVGAVGDQGYAVHHATAWWLNFGFLGLLIGAAIMGLIWAYLFNLLWSKRAGRSVSSQVFASIAFFTFTGSLPSLVRTGPEGYKGVIIESFMIPMIVIVLAARRHANSGVSNAMQPWMNAPRHEAELAGQAK